MILIHRNIELCDGFRNGLLNCLWPGRDEGAKVFDLTLMARLESGLLRTSIQNTKFVGLASRKIAAL